MPALIRKIKSIVKTNGITCEDKKDSIVDCFKSAPSLNAAIDHAMADYNNGPTLHLRSLMEQVAEPDLDYSLASSENVEGADSAEKE